MGCGYKGPAAAADPLDAIAQTTHHESLMGTRSKCAHRCPRCRMQAERCLCELIPTVETRTWIVVVMHRRERFKTTSTAHLAKLALPNLDIRLRGFPDSPLQTDDLLDPRRRPLMLFPSLGARVLSRELVVSDPRPITLIVPGAAFCS